MRHGMLKKIIGSLCLFSLIAFVQAGENSNAFNKYMSPEGGINPMSGTVALQKNIASIAVGQLSTNFAISYSGNVFKDANTRNIEISSGIVGLGWSLGRTQIVCDCKDNAFLDDDIYYLITADGNRYKIFEEQQWRKTLNNNYNGNAEKHWVIEGNPYWHIEREVGVHVDPSNKGISWQYVKGWKITDTEGIVHVYGDIDDVNPIYAPKHNATEYDIMWMSYDDGKRFDLMEIGLGGETVFYPVAWNLSKETDLDENNLTYNYVQIVENLSGTFRDEKDKLFAWTSRSQYTKESYLSEVVASDGGKLTFTYEDKGVGEFEGEYQDILGEEYEEDNGVDMFKEKIVRKYLSQVEVFAPGKEANSKKNVGKVTFCYSSLQPKTPFVKRLLSSIRFFNKDQKEVDFENYEYYTDVDKAKTFEHQKNAYPLGALHSIKGKSCGWVEYTYWYESMGNDHVEELPLKKIFGQGYLEDGTPYLVGKTSEDVLQVYTRQLGKWVFSNKIDVKGIEEVDFGDAGWFLAKEKDDDKKESSAYICQWDGIKWVNVADTQNKMHFDTPFDFDNQKVRKLVAGPDYVLAYTLDDEKGWGWNDGYLEIELVWTKWAGKTNQLIKLDGVDDNDGSGFVIQPAKNRILVAYQDGSSTCTGNCLGYKVYNLLDGVPQLVHDFGGGYDSENSIVLNGSSLIDAGEGTSFYNKSRVQLFGWNGSKYVRQLRYPFSNSDPADVAAVGDDYYIVRYGDRRFIRIFEFDGESWNPEAYFEKLLTSWSLNSKYYWAGVGGNDFIVTARAYQKAWYKTMHRESRVKVIHKKEGFWKPVSFEDVLGNSDQRSFIVGNDWFLENRKSKFAWIWDGQSWVKEDFSDDLKGYEADDIYSLGGDAFAASKDGKTKIFYKINNSFKKAVGTYFVREKKILEPVTDQTILYKYSFLSSENHESGIAYDAMSNTPLMKVMKVEMPNGAGIHERYLCTPPNNGVDENVAVGYVCKEIMRGKQGSGIISETRTIYIRDRKIADLYPVYVDKPSKTIQISRGVKTVTENTYSPSNGMIQNISKKIGDRKTEELFTYVNDLMSVGNENEIVKSLKKQNRINILAGSYSCIPDCQNGMVVAASANGLEKVGKNYVSTTSWKYSPKTKDSKSTVDSHIKNIFFNDPNFKSDNWELQSHNSRYEHKQVVETEEGPRKIKITSFLENKENGKMLGNAANCGFDEGLMLSGESCDIANWKNCLFGEVFVGYAVDLKTDSKLSDYGRFSNKAIKLNSQIALTGTLDAPRKEKYRFSTWVQTTANDVDLKVSVDGKNFAWNLKSKNIDKVGKWRYIEEIFDMTGIAKTEIVLTTNSTSSVYLQDIRLLPLKATSTASFWNEEWDKIQATVNTRGIGSYVKFDNMGREVETYSETAERDVYLASRKTLVDGNCSLYPDGSDVLKSLKLNGELVDVPTGADLSKTITLTDVDFSVEFETLGQNDNVKYSLVPENTSDVWESPACCAKLTHPVASFAESQSWTLKIDVEPFDSNVYKFVIKKKESDWVEYGNMLGFAKGKMPKYQNAFDSSKVIYKDNKRYLFDATYDGNNWKAGEDALFSEAVSAFYPAHGLGLSYLAYIPEDENNGYRHPNVFNKSGLKWDPYNFSENDVISENVKIIENAEKNAVILYDRDPYIHVKTDENGVPLLNKYNLPIYEGNVLCAKVWDPSKNDFVDLGSTPIYSGYKTSVDVANKTVNVTLGSTKEYHGCVVEDGEVFASDIVLGPNNKLYVAYLGNSKMLSNDDLGLLAVSVENEQIAAAESVPFVYLKQLYEPTENPSGKQIWAGVSQKDGTPVSYGDVLSWSDDIYDAIDNVKRIKLATDGKDLYLAVMYEVDFSVEDTDNAVYTVLTVFKGEIKTNHNVNGQVYDRYFRWNAIRDNSIKTIYRAKTIQEEQGIVAYLNDSDDFDFEVRVDKTSNTTVPYIMFRNHENNDKISVISYRNNRWLSVGNPVFAKPQMYVASADLGVNDKGNPFVIFHADNAAQKNKIVGMHYNPKNAPDLTLSSIETNDAGFNTSCAFRQYILNYESKVENQDAFTLKVTPRTPSDLKEILFLNNTTGSVQSLKQYDSYVSVPVAEDWNDIEVRLVGYDDSFLSYNFRLFKEVAKNPMNCIVSTMASGCPKFTDDKTIELDIVPTIMESGVNEIVVDIHFETGWIFILDGVEYVVPGTIELNLDELPKNAKLVSENGEEYEVVIKNGTAVNPNVDPTDLPWYISPDEESKDDGDNGGDSDEGSEDEDSGNGNNDGSLNTDISDNVPDIFRSITKAKIYTTGNVTLADRVTVYGDVFAGNNVNVGVATLNGKSIYAGNSLVLRNRADVNDVYYVNFLEVQDGASYKSATKLNSMRIPVIPTIGVYYGITDVVIDARQNKNISSGSYKDFVARDETTIHFGAGDYYFKSFYTDSRVTMEFEPGTRIWIAENVRIGNYNKLQQTSRYGDFFIYVGQDVSVETNVQMDAVVVAPHADVRLSSGSHIRGYVYAQSLDVQPDCIVE